MSVVNGVKETTVDGIRHTSVSSSSTTLFVLASFHAHQFIQSVQTMDRLFVIHSLCRMFNHRSVLLISNANTFEQPNINETEYRSEQKKKKNTKL